MKGLPKMRHENLGRYGFWIEAIVGDESCVLNNLSLTAESSRNFRDF